jgi:hypothetical protein
VYGGVEGPEEFAERFYARMEESFQVVEAAHVVVKGDGAGWIGQGATQVCARHVFQLDHWHLLDRSEKFAGHLPRVWKRLRPQVSPPTHDLLTHGTGAMEKNIETVIGRRFKRSGKRWTRSGSHHLLKLHLWITRCGTSWFEALNAHPAQLTNA